MDSIWIITFLLLGGFIGFMAGLLGIGGGGMLVPILTSIFLMQGVSPDNVVHLALGTSMASMVITTLSSFHAHNKAGNVVWQAVKGMAPGIVLGGFTATFIAANVDSFYLAVFFALFMAFVSAQMLLNKKPEPSRELAATPALFGAGTGIGAISALVSIGGGSLTVPYLVWQNIDIKRAIGTSAAIGVPIALAGTLGYLVNGWGHISEHDYVFGFVHLPAVLLISATSLFTAPIGVKMTNKLPITTLKKIFAVLLILLSIKMLVVVF